MLFMYARGVFKGLTVKITFTTTHTLSDSPLSPLCLQRGEPLNKISANLF